MTDLNLSRVQQFYHDSKWWWLRLRLADECRLDDARTLLRHVRVLSKGFKVHPELALLMRLR